MAGGARIKAGKSGRKIACAPVLVRRETLPHKTQERRKNGPMFWFFAISPIINAKTRLELGFPMKRSDLSHAIRETLKRLPPPFEAHFGIVPPPPPEDGVAISHAMKSLDQARGALGKIDAIAGQM